MKNSFSSALCATALLLSGASLIALTPPAQAAGNIQIGFNFFHDRLASSGRWIHHPLWGDVWHPRRRLVGEDFQPYTNGHWELTDEYGWYWVSDDPFDDVVYHYGRWVYDPEAGWLWVPGYTWAPAWVVWREGDDYTGWMPLPPDQAFLSGTGVSFGVNLGPIGIDFYRRWYGARVDPARFFVFVDNRHLVERDYRRFVVPRERVVTIINRTRPVARFEIVNNRVVNRGIDVRVIERATGRRIAPVSAKVVIKPNAVITTVNEAKEIRQRERAQHPIEAERRGPGAAPGAEKGNAAEPNAPGAANETKETTRERNRENKAGNGEENGTGAGGSGAEQGTPATGETGKKKSGKQTGTETQTGATGNGAEQGNPATGEAGKPGKKKAAKPGDETPETGNSMMGASPNATGAGPGQGNENEPGATPKRRRPSGSMSGPGTEATGPGNPDANAGPGESGPTPPPRNRNSGTSGNMGTMNGPNPGPGNAAMSSGQNAPANGAEQPKKKKKPKTTNEEQPNTPE